MLMRDLHPAFQEQARRKLRALRAVSSERVVSTEPGKTQAKGLTLLGPRGRGRRPGIPNISKPAERFAFHLKAEQITGWTRELAFHPTRKWRFDFAFAPLKLAIEIDGGTHTQGRHTRGKGYAEDCVKLNEAWLLGWNVIRFTSEQVKSGMAVRTTRRALEKLKRT